VSQRSFFRDDDGKEEMDVLFEDRSLPNEMRWLLSGVPIQVPDPLKRVKGVPVEFFLSGERHRVLGVNDTWPDPDFMHFKVRTDEGAVFLLHHHMGTDTWLGQFLELMDS
jgi:hypothetical protein